MPSTKLTRAVHALFSGRTRPCPCSIRVPVLALVIICAPAVFAEFGDVLEIKGNSRIPNGWVIIEVTGHTTCSTGLQPEPVPSSFTFKIKDVKDAPIGTVEEVRGNSMTPDGWVIIDSVWPIIASTGRQTLLPDHMAVHIIKRIA